MHTWLVPMWLLDTSGGWGRLSGNLRRVRNNEDEIKMLRKKKWRNTLEASCLRGAFPPVDLRAVCLVLAIVMDLLLFEWLVWVVVGVVD